ncbi:acyl-CoA dehydrogenase family protein, partial [Mesorhizobium sp. M8A.F.Ca.ET.181.01.1.1]
RFRGIFAEIGKDSIRHDLERELRFDDYEALKKAGFSRLRLPEKFGGLGLTLPELFGLIIELAQADPNLTNAYRSHLGFTEDLLNAPASPWRDAWLERIGRGETIGSGFSE